jgi:NTE family protein
MTKIGLCLTGGGSRGAYQIGVAKALEERGLLARVEAFSGTSIGSVNAAILATMSPDRALALWKDMSPDEIKSTEGTFRRLMKEKTAVIEKGIYTIAPLESRLRAHLDLDLLAEKEVYVTLSRGEHSGENIFALLKTVYDHYVKQEKNVLYCNLNGACMDDAIAMIIASCSIPVVFPAVQKDGRKYYDGGLYDNVPVRPLVEGGCTDVIVIHLWGLEYVNQYQYPNTRFIEIRPSVSLGWMLNFDPAKSEKLYRIGYDDAQNHFLKHPLSI